MFYKKYVFYFSKKKIENCRNHSNSYEPTRKYVKFIDIFPCCRVEPDEITCKKCMVRDDDKKEQ